ncbi:MAG: AMP-binding protein [Alphaproteobacteria bacterium]|nr:AMP-binding protein [Alphaproteobacteria bacterium]
MLTGQMLERSAKRFPDKAAIICGAEQLTYSALDEQANRLANALLELGLDKGAKVAMLSRNLPEYGIVFFGVARTGYVLTNISVLYAPDELAFVLDKADVEVLIFDAIFAEKATAVRARVAGLKHLIAFGENPSLQGVLDFQEFVATQPATAPDVDLCERDAFCMTYTGGTTGRPKGVLCNHRARALTAHTVMVEEAIDERDHVGIVTPLFHVAALNIMFQPAILAGATTLFLPKWDPADFVAMVDKHKMTANFMVPTQAVMLLNDERFDAQALKSWRKVSFAGAPLPDWVQVELRERLPDLLLTQIYGQSEMGVISVLRHWYLPEKLGSVGRQAYNVDTRVVDPEGRDVAPGEIGEIVSRGDNLMMEYYNEPEQTREFFKLGDGWGWSGDVGTIDAAGFITLIDRSKDMIISGGENIYPKEIEDAIYQLPQVAECAVFGVPDDKWGEVPAAYLKLKPGTQLHEDTITEHCAAKLAQFKRPRVVTFVDDFPRTPIGKIQKNILKEDFWSRREKKI